MILAYDIGTTHLKAAVVTIGGKVLASAQVPGRMVETDEPGRRECDPNTWLSGMAMVTAQLGLREKGRIRGVVVSANGPTLVPVDAAGDPLDFAMTWMDRRAEEEADLIAEYSDAPLDASFYLPKAFWIMRHKPEIYERTRHFLPCAEYVSFFLTGNAVRIVPTELFRDFFWNEPAIPHLRMDQDKFPPFVDVGDLIGTVRTEAEEMLGIPAGVPVIAGGPAHHVDPGHRGHPARARLRPRRHLRGSQSLLAGARARPEAPVLPPRRQRRLQRLGDDLLLGGGAGVGVRALGTGRSDIDALLKDAAAAPPGARRLLFLPFLSAERFAVWDSHMRGAFVGLTLSHGKGEMMRAVVESSGYAVRSVLDVMEEVGCRVGDLRVTGGLARLPLWCQMRADITGRRCFSPSRRIPTSSGMPASGFYGLEEFDSPANAAENLVRFQKVYHPNVAARQAYDELFTVFTKACAELGGTFRGLTEERYAGRVGRAVARPSERTAARGAVTLWAAG